MAGLGDICAALKKRIPEFSRSRNLRVVYSPLSGTAQKMMASLSFIVPDTFLTLAAHRELREVLLKRTEILEIVTLPSKLFPGVAFLILEPLYHHHSQAFGQRTRRTIMSFRVIAVTSSDELESLARGEDAGIECHRLAAGRSSQRLDSRIWTSGEEDVEIVLHAAKLRLGDVAGCKTGIYTGDNKRFIRAITGALVRGAYYESVPRSSRFAPQTVEPVRNVQWASDEPDMDSNCEGRLASFCAEDVMGFGLERLGALVLP